MHDEMTQLVCDIEALPIIVAFDRIEDHHWSESAGEGVRIHRGCLRWAEDDKDAVVLEQTDEVTSRAIPDIPALANETGSFLWAVKVAIVGGDLEGRNVEVGKLDVALQAPGDVNCQLPVGKGLVS